MRSVCIHFFSCFRHPDEPVPPARDPPPPTSTLREPCAPKPPVDDEEEEEFTHIAPGRS